MAWKSHSLRACQASRAESTAYLRKAGIIQGGGKWPKRLTALCRSIVEDAAVKGPVVPLIPHRFYWFVAVCSKGMGSNRYLPPRQ